MKHRTTRRGYGRALGALGFVFVGLALAAASCTSAPLEELLAGKACDASGNCAAGYECDRHTLVCVVQGSVNTGGQGTGGTGGGDDHCDNVGQCPAPPVCQTPICLQHVCGTVPGPVGPLAANQQTAGDCATLVCDGLGNADPLNDDLDLPVDASDCTDDLCIAGVPTHQPTAFGTGCTSGGGRTCDGNGNCVACVAAADCTDIQPTECMERACNGGTCMPSFLAVGTELAIQTAGDCKLFVCDGAGFTTTHVDDTDKPFDDNPCTSDDCSGGTASNPPMPPNTPCGTGLSCDATGHCMGCTLPSECPGSDTSCRQRTCDLGLCGFAFVTAGTPLPAGAQTVGDCKESQCDGSGNVQTVADDADLPPDDGETCTTEICDAGAPLHTPAPVGTACQEGTGVTCDGAGACVECNAPADCLNNGTTCQSAICTNHSCGLGNTSSGTPAPASAQTAGDCTVLVCDGSGGLSAQVDGGDLPVDGNSCTSDQCSGTTPSNPPLPPGSPCSGGGTCDANGNCSNKLPDGGTCTNDVQCTNGHCVDGVCCGSTCTGLCRACSAAKTGGANGTCGNVTQGQDPDLECQSPDTCNGSAACGFTCGQQPVPPAASCPAACTGGCGNGTCIIACNTTAACLGLTLACPAGFACQVQCGANQACDNATVQCPDRYACEVICTGSCAGADVVCSTGTCDLECSGNKCQNATVSCGANRCTATCQGGTAVPAVSCNNSCDCLSCSHANGTACTQGSQCVSGNCVDQVCCDLLCDGLCEACNLNGLAGTCSAVPNGQDPAAECVGSATCNGNRACSLKGLGDSCVQGNECQSNSCAENVCCQNGCAQTCRSCLDAYNGGAGNGTCGFITNGLDPYHECPGPKVCTGSGTCSN